MRVYIIKESDSFEAAASALQLKTLARNILYLKDKNNFFFYNISFTHGSTSVSTIKVMDCIENSVLRSLAFDDD